MVGTIVVTTPSFVDIHVLHDLSNKNLCVFYIFEVTFSEYLDNQLTNEVIRWEKKPLSILAKTDLGISKI